MTEQLSDRRTGAIADVMTEEVISVTPVATATEVAMLMRDHGLSEVFVVENGRLCGRITDRDLVVKVLADGLDPLSVRAGALRSDVPVALAPDTAVDQAARIMNQENVRRLPVVDHQGRPKGTLTMGDLARYAVSASTSVARSVSAGAIPRQR